MGRPAKQTVEYFPHYVHHGKTLFILEQRWGVHGYAGFYKLLEILADEPGHYYDARKTDKWEFLVAKMGVSAPEILQKLSDLDIIDSALWSVRVIWMESFVLSVKEAYRKRDSKAPTIPPLSLFLPQETGENPSFRAENSADGDTDGVSGDGNPQRREEKNKEKKKKEKSIGDKPPTTRFIPPKIEDVIAYCQERNKGVDPQRWFNHYTANGWMVGKNKMKDWQAAVRTWENPPTGNSSNGNGNKSERQKAWEAARAEYGDDPLYYPPHLMTEAEKEKYLVNPEYTRRNP